MKINNKISTFIAALLLVGLVFPLLSANLALGVGPILGCCTTEDGGGQCVGCPEGKTCLSSSDFCESQDGFFDMGSCFEGGGGAVCGFVLETEGCCVVEPGNCADVESSEACFFEVSEFAEIFISNTSCSEVPQCTPTRNIPTMSNWGLIALAGLFILVGVWAITRKKAEA